MRPRIAILSFPGNNGDTENLRCFWRNGFDAVVFRWNDSREKLANVDGYFIGAGFSFEDRGRAGMVAARDPLFQFLHEEAERGKVIVGHCNGCQMLVESGLIPLGHGVRMAVARNIQWSNVSGRWSVPGFLNEWVYIRRTCDRDRCCASDWERVMHVPIAHGEGRFVTKDPELLEELERNDQIAFRYCDAQGNVSEDFPITPNGSTDAIAGICNPAGNVVAMMPHAERTPNGDPYFASIRSWIEKRFAAPPSTPFGARSSQLAASPGLQRRQPKPLEIFIETVIVNNEERTVEQAARRIVPSLKLKLFRYLAPAKKSAEEVLGTISLFNSNKEIAYVRNNEKRGTNNEEPAWLRWNPNQKEFEKTTNPLSDYVLLRRDEPDVDAQALGRNSESGICYSISGIIESDVQGPQLREIFANPHASALAVLP